MASKICNLKILHALSDVKQREYFEQDFLRINETLATEGIDTAHLTSFRNLKTLDICTSLDLSSSNWNFIFLSLECLLCLKNNLNDEKEDSEKLLSVAQQRLIRALLDYIVSVGLISNLLPGVEPHSSSTTALLETSFSDIQKYECLCIVTLGLIELYHDDTFHGILLPQFLSPVLCALCQLTMVPLKKSADTYSRLQLERIIFHKHLDELLNKLYQPMVVKELMTIEGNRKSAKWLKRGVGRLLTAQLHRPRGVFSIVQAVRDAADCTSPTTPAHLESIAKVIMATPHLDIITPQILELMDSNDSELVRVAVLCVRTLHTRDPSACHSLLLKQITQPLMSTHFSEQHLSQCLTRLHKCFAVPASDLWCLPSQLPLPYIHILFKLYCKVYQSASHSRKIVEDLIWKFLTSSDEPTLRNVFRCFVYKEQVPGIVIQNDLEFSFGDDGGVKLIQEEQEHSLEEYGDCLMILLDRRDGNGLLGNKLFVTLLEFHAEENKIDTIDILEKQLVTVKLLAVLSENTAVHKSLSDNPEAVVKFLRSMIGRFLKNSSKEVDIISIVLVVLNVILNDFIQSRKSNWSVFIELDEPLSQLKNRTESTEVRLLAEEAYEVIKTHGAVKPKNQSGQDKRIPPEIVRQRENSCCDEALREACDPLLPLRGHAIMQLGKLLAAGDKQAKAKKDQILCIFQENLKDEDSFLYLSAIEGLAIAAAEFPDTVIVSLTEQFTMQSLKPETRLKVGEALVRVTNILGDLVPVYKAELINAFLWATKDDDFLVRASSLSSLGELCRVLGFRVGPIVTEVLMCARCIVSSDPSVEVRRAAVMLITLLLKGLQKDTFIVLQDVLLELYHSLKHIYSSDKDDVTRLHAQLALEELNSGTLTFLFPKPQLNKQIFVLDPPS